LLVIGAQPAAHSVKQGNVNAHKAFDLALIAACVAFLAHPVVKITGLVNQNPGVFP
jgi:5-enolpyruvylshikimate-3-phosphate synthase